MRDIRNDLLDSLICQFTLAKGHIAVDFFALPEQYRHIGVGVDFVVWRPRRIFEDCQRDVLDPLLLCHFLQGSGHVIGIVAQENDECMFFVFASIIGGIDERIDLPDQTGQVGGRRASEDIDDRPIAECSSVTEGFALSGTCDIGHTVGPCLSADRNTGLDFRSDNCRCCACQ